MKGTTNAQRNAVVDSSSAVDKLTLTLADGTTQQHTVSDMIPKDAEPTTGSAKFVTSGAVKTALDKKVDKVDGKGLSTNDYTTTEKNKLAGISAGAQVNVIEEVQLNGSKITPSSKAVNIDLSNYATKGDVSAIPKFAISVVSSLPTSDISTSTIYLLSNGGSSGNSYDEYLYVNSAWEKIGTTEVDLSGYVPTTRTVNNKQLNANITLTAGDVGALPADGTATKATADANGNNIATTYATQTALTNGLAAKQNALTFDSAPTSGSSNPVTSGGVFSAINSIGGGGEDWEEVDLSNFPTDWAYGDRIKFILPISYYLSSSPASWTTKITGNLVEFHSSVAGEFDSGDQIIEVILSYSTNNKGITLFSGNDTNCIYIGRISYFGDVNTFNSTASERLFTVYGAVFNGAGSKYMASNISRSNLTEYVKKMWRLKK